MTSVSLRSHLEGREVPEEVYVLLSRALASMCTAHLIFLFCFVLLYCLIHGPLCFVLCFVCLLPKAPEKSYFAAWFWEARDGEENLASQVKYRNNSGH